MPLATYPGVNPPYPVPDPVLHLVPPHRRAALIARRGGGPGSGIRLPGPGQTAFFAF